LKGDFAERALILAPAGRDAVIAAGMLSEAGMLATTCGSVAELLRGLEEGAGFALVTEEALFRADLHGLAAWIEAQPGWSDMPFVVLTQRGGGLERNPQAGRLLTMLGNVTFLERPFHPTTLVSLAQSALRARRRQYDARARLIALQESEDHYRHTVELNPQVTWTAPPDGLLDTVARRWFEWTGTTGLGTSWGDAIHPEDLVPSNAAWGHSLATGEPYDIEHRVRMRDGSYHWMHSRASPRRDAAGAIVKWYGTTEDIQERKSAEDALRRANETLEARVEERTREHEMALAQLHEAQKLETLGHLTGGVAHDFNNLLTPVIGNLDLLRRRLGDGDERAVRLIESGLQAAGRAATLVQRLLAFARRQDLQPRSVAIPALLDGMTDMIARSLGPSIQVEISHDPHLPPARVDPNQLELAILNLAINARDAMPGGGRLRVHAGAAEVAQSGRLNAGRYVRIAVADTGVGMDQKTLARAIEPFFSTKGVGKGTGLGLSMVHGLAAQLGGMLDLQSAPGEGTTADIWLPVASEIPQPAEGEQRVIRRPVQQATILLVDDEELVRSGTADMLRDIGYEVIEAASATEAMRVLRSGTAIDLLVTDYLMPGMNGVDLAQLAQPIAPELPVLLITGYSTIADGPGATLPRLAKPFRQADLAARVAALLSPEQSAEVIRMIPRSRSVDE
jgi:PAS domain S-box-containing protein